MYSCTRCTGTGIDIFLKKICTYTGAVRSDSRRVHGREHRAIAYDSEVHVDVDLHRG
eukprot:SAG31_NODE_16_length_36206_cov_27.355728_11_plen_57_part_00